MAEVIKPSKVYILPSSPGAYTKIINETINDKKLIGGLLEMLIYIRSKPPTWKVRAAEVADRFDLNTQTAQKRISKLIELGYIKREKLRNANGSFEDFEIYVADNPMFKDGSPTLMPEHIDKEIESPPIPEPILHDTPTNSVNQEPLVENPLVVEPLMAQPLHSNTYSNNTKLTNHLSKNQSINIGNLISKTREVLANQILVRKQTSSNRIAVLAADDGFFRKRSGRARLDEMNAKIKAEILARRKP